MEKSSTKINPACLNTKEKKWIWLAKTIRVMTVAPVIALIAFLLLWFLKREVFMDVKGLLLAIIFIVVFPILAYPLQPLFPHFKNKGRKGQRQLAIIMSVLGYALGIILSFALSFSNGTKMIFICYSVAGLLIFLFTKFTPIKASGHTCGVAGPVIYLTYFLGAYALFGLILLAFVYWSSLYMKRHTLSELAWGTMASIIAFLSAYLFIVVL